MSVIVGDDAEYDPRGEIHIIWCVEDILGMEPELTAREARHILADIEHHHDCNIGITWEVVRYYIDEYIASKTKKEARFNYGTRSEAAE